MGVLADLMAANRKLIERNLRHVRQIEDRLKFLEQSSTQTPDPKPQTKREAA
jgi:hypothetical protein